MKVALKDNPIKATECQRLVQVQASMRTVGGRILRLAVAKDRAKARLLFCAFCVRDAPYASVGERLAWISWTISCKDETVASSSSDMRMGNLVSRASTISTMARLSHPGVL